MKTMRGDMTRIEELFADGWIMRSDGLLSVQEHDLYNYLLQLCLRSGMNVVYQSSEVLCAILGINANALCTRRGKLQALQLIKYRPGTGPRRPPRYMVNRLSVWARSKNKAQPQIAETEICTKSEGYKYPQLEEITIYCRERNSVIDPHRFFNYYQTRDWYVGSTRMKDWQAALRVWELNDQNRRQGFVTHDNMDRYVQF